MSNECQNPYESFLVEASAGSGKTYQLCQRFLQLVAAHAPCESIVTVTFTVKAAQEMQQRILEEATELLNNVALQEKFAEASQAFYRESLRERILPKPLDPQKVGKKILGASQRLKITTIDALFHEWVNRFPYESSVGQEGLVFPFRLQTGLESEELDRRAWQKLFHPENFVTTNSLLRLMMELDPEFSILKAQTRVLELFRNYTYLWQKEQESENLFAKHIPHENQFGELPSLKDLFQALKSQLRTLAQLWQSSDLLLEAFRVGDWDLLLKEKFFTKEGKIHGGKLRGEKRASVQHLIDMVEEGVACYFDQMKITQLNYLGEGYVNLYRLWLKERMRLKQKERVAEFQDLATGCYRLFLNPENTSVTWHLQNSMHHLLLDEFQDTSLLQWSVFEKLIEELLSGQGNTPGGSVLIVGDKKQSIYGFREADPEVMEFAKATLEKFHKPTVALNASYRSSPQVLSFVNRVFQEGLGEQSFPTHVSAVSQDGFSLTPQHARVVVAKPFVHGGEEEELYEQEANFVANYLKQAFTNPDSHPVFSKSQKGYRPLKPRDCCILYRKGTHLEIFEKTLRRMNLPYQREEKKGFFQRQEILDSFALLEYLAMPANMIALLSFLRSPLGRVKDEDVLYALEASMVKAGSHEHCPYFLQKLQERVPEMVAHLRFLQLQAYRIQPHELLAEAYSRFAAYVAFQETFQGMEGELAQNHLSKYLQILLSVENQGYSNLLSCVERLREMARKNEEGCDYTQSEVITLMTIHKSKGLEFPLVALIGCAERWWERDDYWCKVPGGSGAITYVGTSDFFPKKHQAFQKLLEQQNQKLEKESERLLYVAITRASQYLVLSGSQKEGKESRGFLSRMVGMESDDSLGLSFRYGPGDEVAGDSIRFGVGNEGTRGVMKPFWKIAEIPSEIEIVSPHLSLEKGIVSSSTQHPKLARHLGILIHEGLSGLVCGEKIDLRKLYEKYWKKFPLLHSLAYSGNVFEEWEKEILGSIEDPEFCMIFAGAKKIQREVPIIHLKGNELVRGMMDLFAEWEDTVKVVELKTSVVRSSEEVERGGYYKQLGYYKDALCEMYPEKKVEGILWFSK